MKNLLELFGNREFVIFVTVGAIAAAINFLSRIVIDFYTSYSTAVIIAYILGMVVAFLLNRRLVFKKTTNKIGRQITVFVLVNLLGIAQTYVVSIVLAEYMFPSWGFVWHKDEVAHFIGICVPTFTSYIGHKFFTFRN